MTTTSKPMPLTEVESFVSRHIGPSAAEQRAMLDVLGYPSLDEFIDAAIPEKIRFRKTLSTNCGADCSADLSPNHGQSVSSSLGQIPRRL